MSKRQTITVTLNCGELKDRLANVLYEMHGGQPYILEIVTHFQGNLIDLRPDATLSLLERIRTLILNEQLHKHVADAVEDDGPGAA